MRRILIAVIVLSAIASWHLSAPLRQPAEPPGGTDVPTDLSLTEATSTVTVPAGRTPAVPAPSQAGPMLVALDVVSNLKARFAMSSDVPDGLDRDGIVLAHLSRLQDLLISAQDTLSDAAARAPVTAVSPVPDLNLWLELSTGTQTACVAPSSDSEFYTAVPGPCQVSDATAEFFRDLLAANSPDDFLTLLEGRSGQ